MIAVITHGDLDGLTAGSILFNVASKRDSVVVFIAQPYMLHKVLEKASALRDVSETYIVDISIDPGTWGRSSYYLKNMAKGSKLYWIDHHKTTVENICSLLEIGAKPILSMDFCSSRIVAEMLLNLTDDYGFFSRLAVIGEIGDKMRTAREGTRMAVVVNELGASLAARPTDNEFKIRLMKMWAIEKVLIDDEVLSRARQARIKLDSLLRKAEHNKLYEGNKYLVVDLRGENVRGYVSKIASEKADAVNKLVLVLFNPNADETVFTFRVPRSMSCDITDLIKSLSSSFGGSGGGHKKAASFRVPQMLAEHALEYTLKYLKRLK